MAPRPSTVLIGLVLTFGSSCRNRTGPPQHYDDPKRMIGLFEASERDAWQMPDRVIRSLPLTARDAVVADIGAGSGYFTRRLAAVVPEGRVYAVDVDGQFADYIVANREAWGTPNIEPHLALYDDPMLPTGELDLVFTANTYAFIRDRVAYFGKVRSSLKPGGRLAVLDFRPDAKIEGDVAPDPGFRIPREKALEELAQAGFTLKSEETFLPHQWFLVLERKG